MLIALSKPLFRAATAVRQAVAGPVADRGLPDLAAVYCQELQKLDRHIKLAESRGWDLAAAILCERLATTASLLQNGLTRCLLDLRQAPRPVASVADIYRDLVALSDDFDNVRVDEEQREICATCRPIVLDGMIFGPFEIRLNWVRSKPHRSYRVVALEPRPAGSNSSVTHPHVSDESLCEGDGAAAIQAALAAGRIGDFFLLVAQILNTYGSGRAYVELDEWDGEPCHECGGTMGADDRCYCASCDELICEGCSSCCPECDQLYCEGCLECCSSCNAKCCSSCLAECAECHVDLCENCVDQNLCPSCQETHEKLDQEDQDPSPAAAPTAVQPLCLGEAAVLA